MIELFGNILSFRWYRRLFKGNWKYVGPKWVLPPMGCWIRNKEPLSFEFIWEEENY